ncbi:hypothetical protein ATANTOWER_018489 [Ataeniobius toweri]|uniref:Uncharacterized protein n=1 Tax=Ataeniobius toweri TaxID=208326 RepID=A0ABU7BKJ8_9TELE|nr:hypothetical protein [Ataeniobius toweri]
MKTELTSTASATRGSLGHTAQYPPRILQGSSNFREIYDGDGCKLVANGKMRCKHTNDANPQAQNTNAREKHCKKNSAIAAFFFCSVCYLLLFRPAGHNKAF